MRQAAAFQVERKWWWDLCLLPSLVTQASLSQALSPAGPGKPKSQCILVVPELLLIMLLFTHHILVWKKDVSHPPHHSSVAVACGLQLQPAGQPYHAVTPVLTLPPPMPLSQMTITFNEAPPTTSCPPPVPPTTLHPFPDSQSPSHHLAHHSAMIPSPVSPLAYDFLPY